MLDLSVENTIKACVTDCLAPFMNIYQNLHTTLQQDVCSGMLSRNSLLNTSFKNVMHIIWCQPPLLYNICISPVMLLSHQKSLEFMNSSEFSRYNAKASC